MCASNSEYIRPDICSLPARGFHLATSSPLGRKVLVEWMSVDWIQERCGHKDTPRLWYRRGATLLEGLHEWGKQKTCYGSRWPPCYGQRLLVWKALFTFNYVRGWIQTTPSSTYVPTRWSNYQSSQHLYPSKMVTCLNGLSSLIKRQQFEER